MMRLSSKSLWAAAVLLTAVMCRARQAVLTGDTELNSADTTMNYGSRPALTIGGTKTTLVRFDVAGALPSGTTAAEVAKATLVLFPQDVIEKGTVNAYEVTSHWAEETVTYETKPALSKTVAASATISAADSFVESPDMMNIYNGNIVTDSSGLGVVTLPDWFEALNRDFRYQLTVIGQFAQAVVAQEVANGRFVIRTDKPGVKVSAAASQAQHPDPAREVKIWSVTRAVQVAGCGTESWHP